MDTSSMNQTTEQDAILAAEHFSHIKVTASMSILMEQDAATTTTTWALNTTIFTWTPKDEAPVGLVLGTLNDITNLSILTTKTLRLDIKFKMIDESNDF